LPFADGCESKVSRGIAMKFGIVAGVAGGVLGAVGVALIVGLTAIEGGLVPANADAKPGRLELWAAGTSLAATLRREAPTEPNPINATDENLTAGVKLYGQHCAICHGTAAGDASASPIARGEYPQPPQFGTDGVEDDAEGLSFWKIKHGIRLTGMPSWKDTLSDQQIWTLALFLKHMDKLPPNADAGWKRVGADSK
jgi:thiosulfate dehydrogenase